MISDILHQAEHDIKGYLANPTYHGVYQGHIRDEIIDLVGHILYVRQLLDHAPAPNKTLTDKPQISLK